MLFAQLAQPRSGSRSPVKRRGTCSAKIGIDDAGDQVRACARYPIEIARHDQPSAVAGRAVRIAAFSSTSSTCSTRAVSTAGSISPSAMSRRGIAVPEHRAFAGGLVDQDDGETRRRIADDHVRQVHAAPLELVADQPAVVVVAERAQIAGPQAKPAAGREHAGDLAARGVERRRNPEFGRRASRQRRRRQEVDVIDGTFAKAEDVECDAGGRELSSRRFYSQAPSPSSGMRVTF